MEKKKGKGARSEHFRRIVRSSLSLGWTFWAYFLAIQFSFVLFFIGLFVGSINLMLVSLIAANVLFFILARNVHNGDYF
jgi:Zn-dependent membrane protease YugP